MNEKLALLRALALRPSRTMPPALQPLLEELVKDGYVAMDGDAGWMATAKGCGLIESNRAAAR
jgi:hypothetical protein